ncbi:glycosyltransferase family 2 protein [Candidatus Woesearchaeota archaeon]|nr:glycosyltransferase family 2 protein [Candidatus Woesearchaeota archaeon]
MNLIYNIFVYTIWFLATYYVVLILLILLIGRDKLYEKARKSLGRKPWVSIIVPAYNEEAKISYTIESLKKVIYDKIEFIIVNDGSKDSTPETVRHAIGGDPRFIFIDRKQNKGKAASLNEGIARSKGEFVATIDADSVIEPRMISKVLPYFAEREVAAVTVAVRVKNPKTILHKIFELEYIIGLSLMLKVFSFFNGIFVTPGPFSIYRKSIMEKIGGFDEHNITEDMEIAYRIQKARYRIENCMSAKVYTIVPDTFRQICVQRKRWYSGAIYTLAKHRDMILNKKYGFFGYFMFFNYVLIFMGLFLFLYSTYLLAKNLLENLLYFQYTSFNFLNQLKYFELDYLMLGRTTILGIIAISFTILALLVGLYFTRTSASKRKMGVVGYPFLFFFYQWFWILSIISVVRGKKAKWR